MLKSSNADNPLTHIRPFNQENKIMNKTSNTIALFTLSMLLLMGMYNVKTWAKDTPTTIIFTVNKFEKHPNPKHGLKATGEIMVVGTGLKSVAVSGPWIKGALPAGRYDIERSGFTLKPSETPRKTSYCDKMGNCWFQYIRPTFGTTRTALGIHPDGWTPGTLGCIGLKSKDSENWKKLFSNNKSPKVLVVKYNAPLPP